MSSATIAMGQVLPLGLETRSARVKSSKVSASSESQEEKQTSDKQLVLRAQKGDANAYRELVERYQSRAHAVAMGVVGNYQDAEDIAQEAFVKAYKSLDSFRGQSSFYTWLYRIVFNLSIDLSRKAYRRSEFGTETQGAMDAVVSTSTNAGAYMATIGGPDERLRRTEIRVRFKQAMAELSEEHRVVIVLREIEGLSYTEISDVVGCSKGTVMSRLHHARKRLQKSLADIAPGRGEDVESSSGVREVVEAES